MTKKVINLHYGKPKNWDKLSFSIAVVNHECPICGAPKEYYCVSPEGKKIWPIHNERSLLLTPDEIEQAKSNGDIQGVLKRLKEDAELPKDYKKEYLD